MLICSCFCCLNFFIFGLLLVFFLFFFTHVKQFTSFFPISSIVFSFTHTHIHSHFCLPSICPLPFVLHYFPPPCFPQVSTILHPFSYPSTPPPSLQSSVQGSEHIRPTDSSLPVCPDDFVILLIYGSDFELVSLFP